MHIPDSAVSPTTSLLAAAAMAPAWFMAGARVRDSLETRQAPLLAAGSAFCFTIMLFNIPAPGGTTVHPVGAVLMAILLGPWAALLGMTVALAIQALFFADGGMLTLGINCFTMALAMPFTGYVAYRLVLGKQAESRKRQALAAGVGAYIGLNVGALLTAIALGIQPALYHDSTGRALYFPFSLGVTVPALLIPHLLIAGVAEAVMTIMAVRYLRAAGIPLYGEGSLGERPARFELAWLGIATFVALAPVGLLARGEAWGEWTSAEIARRAGYLPDKLASTESHRITAWLPVLSNHGPIGYIFAASLGVLAILIVIPLISRALQSGTSNKFALCAEGSAGRVNPRLTAAECGLAAYGQFHSETATLPAWLIVRDTPLAAPSPRRAIHFGEFGAKSLSALEAASNSILNSGRFSDENGLLQRIDARVKLVGLVGCVLATSLAHSIISLAGLYLLAMSLAGLSKLPIRRFTFVVLAAAPLFAAGIALPAALNIMTPGKTLLVLWRDPTISITTAGVAAAGFLTFRICTAISFAVLLTMTTDASALLRALRALLVPRLFVAILAMTYRNLATLIHVAADSFMARRSRAIATMSPNHNHAFVGGAIGTLFGRALSLSEETHSAMLSRGWAGEIRTLEHRRVRLLDAAWLAAIALFCVGAALLGRAG